MFAGHEGTTGSKGSQQACMCCSDLAIFSPLDEVMSCGMGWRTLLPRHGVRGDFSDLHMFAGLEGTDGPSKCACFFGALTSWSAMGLLFFFLFVTDDLTLRVASSRPLVPRVAVEAHSLATAQWAGARFLQSLKGQAHRDAALLIFFSSLDGGRKKAEHDEHAP